MRTGGDGRSSGATASVAGNRVRPMQPDHGREYFSAAAFSKLVKASMVGNGTHLLSRSAPDALEVGRLDRAPEIEDAWVYGLYVTILNRVPDAAGLRLNVQRLRDGDSPSTVSAGLLGSDEAVHLGANVPDDLNDVFVTGVYLTALGRLPDSEGMLANRQALAAGAITHRDLLDGILASQEAAAALRFPPRTDQLQASRPEPAPIVDESDSPLAADIEPEAVVGLPTRTLVRDVLRRRRRFRSAVREIFTASARTRQVTVEMAHQMKSLAVDRRASEESGNMRLRDDLAVLHGELIKSRDWQWRVDCGVMDQLDRMAITLRGIEDRVDVLEHRLEEQSQKVRPRSPGSD